MRTRTSKTLKIHQVDELEAGAPLTDMGGSGGEMEAAHEPSPRAQWWRNIAKWAVVILVAVIPVAFVPGIPNLAFATQQTVALFLVLVSFVAFIVAILSSGQLTIPRLPRPFLIAGGVFLLAVLVSLMLAPVFSLSFWGVIGLEPTAALNLFIMISVFTLILLLFHELPDIELLAKAFLVALSLTLLLTIVLNVAILGFQKPLIAIQDNSFNLFGTSNALAFFWGLGFIFCLALSLSSDLSRRMRIGVGGLGLLSFIALVLYGNTLIFIVALIGLAVFLGSWLMHQGARLHDHLRELNLILFFVFVFSMILIFGYRFGDFLRLPAEVVPSFQTSLSIAGSSLRQGVQPFLFGSGPNTFAFDYVRFKPLVINLTTLWNTDFQGGYSWWLTLLPTIGAIGVGALLLVFGFILFEVFRSLFALAHAEESRVYELCIVFLSGLIFLLAASFSYPLTFPLLLYLFVFAAVLVNFLFAGQVVEVPLFHNPRRAFLGSIGLTGVLVLVFFLGLTAGQRLTSFFTANQAVAAFNRDGKSEVAIAEITRAYQMFENENVARILSSLWFSELTKRIQATSDPDASRADLQTAFNNTSGFAREAARLNPINHQNWALLGEIYRNVIGVADGAAGEAIAAYTKAREVNPTNPAYSLLIGQLQLIEAQARTGSKDEAIAAAEANLREALRLKPDASDAYSLLGQAYEQQGKLKEAIAQTKEILKSSPDDIGALFQLGYFEYRDQNLTAATESLSQVVSRDPNHANAHYFLGLIYERQGKVELAMQELERVLQTNPGNQEVIGRIEALRDKQ